MHTTIFYVIVSIIIFHYLLERFLAYLNSTRWSNQLPKELEGIYDAEKYKKSQDYEKVNQKLSFIASTFNTIIILLVLFFNGFALLDIYVRSIVNNPILISLLFFAILIFASDIINTPFDIIDTFVIEEKFGFNKTTVKTYIFDKLKSWMLMLIIGGGVMYLIIWCYYVAGERFWIYGWLVSTAFSIFMSMFYSSLIVPLFNKQTPLPEGELRDSIQKFSNKVGFNLDNIFVIDGSKRSTKANAYFTGLGSKKRIVLFDTLIKDFTVQEIVAVLSHEIGHYKKKHNIIGLIIGILQMGVTFYLLSLFVGSPHLSKALGVDTPNFHIGMIAFGILYSPISTILGLAFNIVSRKNEYEADRFAKENYSAEHLITSLKKLSITNLDNLTPHPLYVFFHYSHPPLLERLRALK